MNLFLATVAFCVQGECGFYVWSEKLFTSEKACEAQVVRMEAILAEETGGQANGFSACIRVPQTAT